MKVYYRLTEVPSTNPPPIFKDDKLKLNEICLKSFVEAYQDIKPSVTFLCDYCSPKTGEMIEKLCPFDKTIEYMTLGINGTALQQFFWAYYQKDDILFQECDYIYHPNIGKKIEDAVKELEIVSPYDHPNFYFDKEIHSDMAMIKLIDDVHWRSTERNTMTFAIRNDVYQKTYEIWRRWGYLDDGNWKEVREMGHMLFTPIPSFATHMVSDWMAPSVEWQSLWKTLI
jgi:hypothetical protein